MPDHNTPEFGAEGFTYKGRFYPYIAGGDGEGDGDGSQTDTGNTGDGTTQGDGADQGTGSASDSQGDELAGLKSALAKEREANKANAKLLKDLQKFKQDADAANLSESEKIRKDAEEATTRAQQLADTLRRERTERAMEKAASGANIPAELAERLITVEYDDEGNITTDLEAAAKAIASKYPGLVHGGTSTTSPTKPAKTSNTLTREAIDKMSPAEINARWPEVIAVLEGRQ